MSKSEATSDGGTGGTGLPASIEAAWGLRGRPARGPKPGLSLERIVDAGITVASAEGLGAVSMSRVAAEVGASTMALYRYVEAKDELLALMVDAAYGRPPDFEPSGGDWREGLSRWAWAELHAVLRHPWALRVPMTGPPVTPNQIAWLEQGLRCLGPTKLAESEKLSTILLLSGYVQRWATLATDLGELAGTPAAESDPDAGEPADDGTAYWLALARIIDPERFPAVTAVLTSELAGEGPDDFLAEFVFGLERVLDGIEALVNQRS
ncbi:MAG TPA: TetR/AcrR family transcriptional regulator [Jiangellales bacterium]|nr:TetR/AcrR family transcriptional regulator [Jiangellales bacterium]